MRTRNIRLALPACMMVFWMAFTFQTLTRDARGEKVETFQGIVTELQEKDRVLTVKGTWRSHTFRLGEHCAIHLQDQPDATLKELRPGLEVTVFYSVHDGVRVARCLEQRDREFAGRITQVDQDRQTFTAAKGWKDVTFSVNDARVIKGDETPGSFDDLAPGLKVVVEYTTAAQTNLAHKIALPGLSFTGSAVAIDAELRTLRLKQFFSERTFSLAKDCVFILDQTPDGALKDLRLGDRLTVQYDDVNGVFVAFRVARESSSQPPGTDQLTQDTGAPR